MILVTGASGHVGNAVVRHLLSQGKSIRAMVGSVQKAQLRFGDIARQMEIVAGDVTRPDSLKASMAGVEAVIHLAAIAIEKGGRTYEAINTEGTRHVIEAAKAAGIRRFVNMSQNGASSDIPYRFLRSKGVAQDIVAHSGLDWTAFKPSVIWGPQDEFANVQARLIKLTPIFFPIVGDGQAKFQPVYVGDVAAAMCHSLDDPSTIGGEYGLGGPEVLTYEEIVKRVLKALGKSRLLIKIPVPLLRPVVAVMQTVLPVPPATTTLLDLLAVPNVVPDNALPSKFNITPKPFTPENLSYMKQFKVITSAKKFLGQSLEEDQIREIAHSL